MADKLASSLLRYFGKLCTLLLGFLNVVISVSREDYDNINDLEALFCIITLFKEGKNA